MCRKTTALNSHQRITAQAQYPGRAEPRENDAGSAGYDTLNSESAIAFLAFLLSQQPLGLLHIILDRGRYFYCEAVWAFAAANPRLRLHYLPTYSPNINAIEPSWKIMHEHTTNNRYHATFKQYTEAIRHFFDVTFPQKSREWTDRLTDNFRIIGAPKLA